MPLDLPGLALASGGLLGIVWATTRGNADGWASPSTLVAYALGAALLGAFVAQERRSAAPMLPLGLFRRPGFAAANGAGFGLHFTMFAAFFLIIQYLTQVHGDSALMAGVETLPWTLLPLAVSPFTGALGGRIGSRPMIVDGPAAALRRDRRRGLRDGRRRSYAELVAPLVAIGFGIALVLPNVASAALGSALPEHIGKASGANSTFRQLGAVFGIAVAVLVFDRAGSYASPGAVVDGVRAALFVAAAVGVLGAVAALGIPARARKRPPSRGRLARPTPLAELEAAATARGRRRSSSSPRTGRRRRSARRRGAGSRRRSRRAPARARQQPAVRERRRQPARLAGGSCGSASPASSRTGTGDDPDRSGAPFDVRYGATRPPEQQRARNRGVCEKAPARGSLGRGNAVARPGLSADRDPEHGQAGAGVELGTHVAGELPCQRSAVAGGGPCTSSGTRTASSGERSSTATVVARSSPSAGRRASTRASSARVFGNARRHAVCAAQRAASWRNARSALRAASSKTGDPGSDAPSSVAVRTERGYRRR